MTRLIVLPFRTLRSDPETDFLAFSLPDAITTSLSGLDALVVRSSLAASRFAADVPDFARIAAEAEVDIVLTGTLLRAGDQIRVSTQLVEAPGGAVLWSQTSQATLTDIFKLQDELVERIVGSLHAPLTAREQRMLKRDVPATAKAYEFYLRANQLGLESSTWPLARDLYEQCLKEDPRYAPAWARLGRIYRVLAKYFPEPDGEENLRKAEAAFTRALDLNPDLPLAHNLYAHYEVESGRAREAMLRLIERARGGTSDPELFSGLVLTCRYCGLLEASLAADRRARELDPNVRTSVAYTWFMTGDYGRARNAPGADIYVRTVALSALGSDDEALAELAEAEKGATPDSALGRAIVYFRASLLGQGKTAAAQVRTLMAAGYRDPEGLYLAARAVARAGEAAETLNILERVVEGGFVCLPAFARDPWLDSLRGRPRFRAILRRAESRHREAQSAFLAAGGDRVLGITAA
jgi:TolB-like protein